MQFIGFAALLGFAGTIAALPGQGSREQQVITSTITAEAHPMTFWPLAHLPPAATPLSYGSPPIASRVPGNPHNEVDAANPNYASSTPSAPTTPTQSSPPTSASTTTCTVIKGGYPASTLPGFCRPTLFTNAPSLAQATGGTHQTPLPTAIVTMSANTVPDKVSCCGECAAYYNCFAWRFVPSYVGTPSDRLPGGFDPWRHGNCEIAYYTGNGTSNSNGSGSVGNVTREDAPSVCPNGRLGGVVRGSVNPRPGSWFDGLYYNGWNQGACGEVGDDKLFLGGGDAGVGDESSLCGA